MSLYLGILIALLCAFASNLAFLYKHRGCSTACTVDIRHPLRTARSLWSQRWFAIGMGVGLVAWLLHVAAISLAPLSVVQAVLSGGLVLLAVMADRLFGFKHRPAPVVGPGHDLRRADPAGDHAAQDARRAARASRPPR